MSITYIFFEYIAWHYSRGVTEFIKAWGNIHWFFYHFFSVSVLLKSLFKPFHRISEKYARGFDPEQFFEVFIVNTIMRVVGFVMRGLFLIIAFFAQVLILITGLALFIVFFGAPFIVPVALVVASILVVG